MSRISLHRPRHNRAVWDRPATDTRLLPIPFPNTVSPAVPLSADGRSTDFTRQTPSQGLCRYNAPSYGRFGLADFTLAEDKPASFDAFARALEPFHDSSNRSHPSIPFGAPRHRVVTPSLSSVERCSRTDMPHTETPSNLARLLRHVWGFRRLAADVQHPLRRTIGVGAGVVVFLRNQSRTFHRLRPQQTKTQIESTPSPRSLVTPRLFKESGAEHSRPWRWAAHPVTDGTSACGGFSEAGARSKDRAGRCGLSFQINQTGTSF